MPVEGPLFIVMNAGSGDEGADTREAAIRDVLERGGRAHRLWRVTDPRRLPQTAKEAVELARSEKGAVVAAGGDGTINTVAQAVINSGCPMGVLPQGTFNYFGRTHGIPVDTAEAAAILLTGVARPVQVGLVNDRVFLVNSSLGLYPKLLEKREAHKQMFGRTRLVALFSAIVTLFSRPPQLVLTLEEDGRREVMHILTLMVENNPLQLEEVGLAEAGAVTRGELAAIVVKARGLLQMLGVVAAAALGRLGEASSVHTFTFDSLTVNPLRRPRIKVSTDGEVNWFVPPLLFRVSPSPLLLIVPRAAQADAAVP